MVGNASVVTATRDFGDKWYLVKLQAGWALVGLVAFIASSRFPYAKLEKPAPIIFITCLLLLALVLVPGIGSRIFGARRWINLGVFGFQPSEFAKLATSIYLAALWKKGSRFGQLIIVISVLGFLLMLQPDMGTMLILIGIVVFSYVGTEGNLFRLFIFAPFVILVLVVLAFISPYRASRLKTFFDFSHDPLGVSYQVRQSLIGLGSGGIFGVGLGQSRQKYEFLPEVSTDSIFAVIGEEMGLIGTSSIVIVYMAIGLLGLEVARTSHDRFSAVLATTISIWIVLQAFINVSAIVALLPFTGVPLAFISYGGSSLVVNLVAAGILVGIAKTSSRVISNQPSSHSRKSSLYSHK